MSEYLFFRSSLGFSSVTWPSWILEYLGAFSSDFRQIIRSTKIYSGMVGDLRDLRAGVLCSGLPLHQRPVGAPDRWSQEWLRGWPQWFWRCGDIPSNHFHWFKGEIFWKPLTVGWVFRWFSVDFPFNQPFWSKKNPRLVERLEGWGTCDIVWPRSYLTEHGSMEPMYEDKEPALHVARCCAGWV